MKLFPLYLICTVLVISSCKKKGCTDENALNYNSEAKKDDGSCTFHELPSSYSFTDGSGNSTVSYSGQTDRLNQLVEMSNYMSNGINSALDATALKDMFRNDGNNGGGNFSFSSTKQLANKFFPSDSTLMIGWFDSLANASVDFAATASNGQAGTLTSGTTTFLFDDKGFEYSQMITVGITGGTILYQATDVYLGSAKMGVNNSIAVDSLNGMYYTEMEHHWDEAFGYFGAPIDFPNNVADALFWAKVCNARDAALGSNSAMMNSFLAGRTYITNNELDSRNSQIQIIRTTWERIAARTALAYLQAASTSMSDQAWLFHYLTKAYAYMQILTYVTLETRVISFTQIQGIRDNRLGNNLWDVTAQDIAFAIDDLTAIYGF